MDRTVVKKKEADYCVESHINYALLTSDTHVHISGSQVSADTLYIMWDAMVRNNVTKVLFVARWWVTQSATRSYNKWY